MPLSSSIGRLINGQIITSKTNWSQVCLLAGDALFFYPSCIYAGDSYVKSNICLHYYAFKAGTEWEMDIAYDLPTDHAHKITHYPEVTSKTVKSTLCAQER